MDITLIIDDQYLKDYSPLGKSIDVDEIYPFVYQAQEVYCQDVLGTPLYKDILQKTDNYIAGTGPSFSAVEWELVNLLSKALVHWTTYMAIPSLYVKLRNAGVVKAQAEGTQNADLSEMKYLREEQKNLGEFWNTRCVNYLCANSTDFPLYNAVSDDMYPSLKQYDSDIYIEDGYSDLTFEELRFLKKYLR
jgi:hypothetical protein